MRQLFPTEREMDAMLTRKMERRHMPAYAGIDLGRITGYLNSFLSDTIAGEFRISDQRWFSGGASKIQMGFTLHWCRPGIGMTDSRMVIRMGQAVRLANSYR